MSWSQPPVQPPPGMPTGGQASSWFWPVLIGAILTVLMHLPVLEENGYWVACCCGLGGLPLGIVPVVLALRHDPLLGAQAGFSMAFLSIGIGSVLVAAITVLSGFQISSEFEELLRQSWAEGGIPPDQVNEMVLVLEEAGPFMAVVAAGVTALVAGVTGAIVASWGARRYRSRHPGPTTGSPPAARP